MTLPPWREYAREIYNGFEDDDLLTYASAISFRVFFSLVPLLLFAFALLGFLNLEDIWSNDLAPDVKDAVSPDVFKVMNDTVLRVLKNQQFFWLTVGLGLAIWQVSGAIRLSMGALNRAYGADEDRDLRRQFTISLLLSAASIFLVGLAIATVKLAPFLIDDLFGKSAPVEVLSFLARWAIAATLLLLVVGLLVHNGPDRDRPLLHVTGGAALVVGCWIGISLIFGVYLTKFASYASLFGNLATVFVVIEYIWLSTMAFMTGILIDALAHGKTTTT